MTYFVHHLADCQSKALGIGTTLWQLTVVPAMARVGSNYNISCHCFIENDIAIGDKVTFKSGVYLRDGVTLDNDVFVGPNATFTNDKVPCSKREYEQLKTLVCEGASIGAGAVLLPGVRSGRKAIVGAGGVVARDVPDGGVVYSDAARLRLVNGLMPEVTLKGGCNVD